jgi:hypothetical protein
MIASPAAPSALPADGNWLIPSAIFRATNVLSAGRFSLTGAALT